MKVFVEWKDICECGECTLISGDAKLIYEGKYPNDPNPDVVGTMPMVYKCGDCGRIIEREKIIEYLKNREKI